MKADTKIRKKIEIGMVFQDVDNPDTFYAPHNVIHDLIVQTEENHNVPLAYYINKVLTYHQPVHFWMGDYNKYSEEFKAFITKFREYFNRTFDWKGRKVKLVAVEKCPWVYKRTEKLMLIENETVLSVIWGIICNFQANQKDFVFTILRPFTAQKKTIPYYPYKVEYNRESGEITYTYPKS